MAQYRYTHTKPHSLPPKDGVPQMLLQNQIVELSPEEAHELRDRVVALDVEAAAKLHQEQVEAERLQAEQEAEAKRIQEEADELARQQANLDALEAARLKAEEEAEAKRLADEEAAAEAARQAAERAGSGSGKKRN